jgi:ATP-dependent helicase/nuclease subunit B
MGLHFIYGRAGTGKTRRCYEEIIQFMNKNPDRQAVLLVPDQDTYRAESRLAAAFPGKGFAGVTVCGFSRLAYRVFQELHTVTSESLSPLGQQLIISRLLSQHKKEFAIFRNAAGERHFSQSITEFFHELDTYLVTEDQLNGAAEAEGNTPLGLKLKDLALLYRSYHQYLSEHFSYQGSTYDLLAREIPKSSFLAASRIWIDGFNGMTPQEIRIVRALIETASDVTVTLSMDPPSRAGEYTIWNRPERMWSLLAGRDARADGVTLTRAVRFEDPDIAFMAEHAFTDPLVRKDSAASRPVTPERGIHLVSCAGRDQEIDEIARRILSLVRDQGFRYRDILVLLRNPDTYTDSISRIFHRYRIPVFINERESMGNHPLIILLRSLLDLITRDQKGHHRGWTRNRLFRFLKNDLLPVFKPAETDALENFVFLHGVRPYHWDREWHFHTPFDLDTDTGDLTSYEEAEQRVMNSYRCRVLALLDPLETAWKNAPTVKEKCTLLYQWMMKQDIPRRMAAWDEAEFQAARLRPHLQVWKKVLAMLDEMVHVAGDDTLSPDDFFSMMEDGLTSLSYSMIPPTLDHVSVASVERGYASEGRAVFIPGVVEDEFPARIDSGGFLTEEEKQRLQNEEQLVLGPGLLSQIYQEQFYIYLSMTRARQLMVLTYAETDRDGKDLSPSYLAKNLIRQGYIHAAETASPVSPATKDTSFLSTPEESLSLLPRVLREGKPADDSIWIPLIQWANESEERKALLKSKLRGFTYTNKTAPLGPDLAGRLFKRRGILSSSISQLENYRHCPYRYFLSYGLRLDERDQSDLDPRDFGNYLHSGLSQFGHTLQRSGRQWRDASDEDIETISETIARRIGPQIKYGLLHSDEAEAYTEKSLLRTLRETLKRLRSWSRQSSFDTAAMEKKFLLTLRAEAGEIYQLRGKIDRVDKSGQFFVVADYKTGSVDISLSDILSGLRLQLASYLLAILKENKPDSLLPAAMVYIYLSGDTRTADQVYPASSPPVPAGKELLRGYFAGDMDVLSLLDHGLRADSDENPVLSIRTKKDGSFRSGSPVLSLDEIKHLLQEVEMTLGRLAQQILDGNMPLRPARQRGKPSPCTYCLFRSICRFDLKLGDRYDMIHPQTDKEIKSRWQTEDDEKGEPANE